jgi:hypothetical protein
MSPQKLFVVALCVLMSNVGAYSYSQEKSLVLRQNIDRLYSDDAKARKTAANELVAAGSPAIPLLVRVICDRTKSHFDLAWPAAAKALGDLKAEAATPCLTDLLLYNYPSVGPVIGKPDEMLAANDPAFSALVGIGEPAVPTIKRRLPFLGPDHAIMALRVLRAINAASAREATEAYIDVLRNQLRMATQVAGEFSEKATK